MVVVDALDESANPNDFAQTLHELTITIPLNTTIQVLATSREDLSVDRAIRPFSTSDLSLMSNMRSDISAYVAGEVASRISTGKLKLRNRDLASQIIAKLEEKADGM